MGRLLADRGPGRGLAMASPVSDGFVSLEELAEHRREVAEQAFQRFADCPSDENMLRLQLRLLKLSMLPKAARKGVKSASKSWKWTSKSSKTWAETDSGGETAGREADSGGAGPGEVERLVGQEARQEAEA